MPSIPHPDSTPLQLAPPLEGKRCSRCHEWRPLSGFSRCRRNPDGLQGQCKVCFAQYHAQRYAANREQICTAMKQRYAANREAKKQASARRYTRIRLVPAEVARRQAAKQRWNQAHPDRVRAQYHKDRAKRLHAAGTFTATEWQALKVQYDYRCVCCGKREGEITLTVDHVLPLSEGGRNEITNIQPLCGSCNSSKSNRCIDYRPTIPNLEENAR